MIAISTPTTVTLSVAGLLALLAVLALARSFFIRERSTWRRYRAGFFLERDPDPVETHRLKQPPPISTTPPDEAPTRVDWPKPP